MKIKFFFLLIISIYCHPAFAQLTIEDCYQKAHANYPLIKEYDLISKTAEYNLANANKGYLPQILFSAQATYQSDVTKLPIDASQLGLTGMKIPTLSKDQYGATVDVSQKLWDGGVIKSQKEGIRTANEVDKKNTDVNIYAINERVNQLYFGILLADAQIDQNILLQENLQTTYQQMQAYVLNGIANQSDLDAVKIDQLKAKQSHAQYSNTRRAYIAVLSKLIGEELNADLKLDKPRAEQLMTNEIRRPELELFDAQIRNLESKNKQITAGLMPQLGLFATGGYGKPSLNMFKDKFSAYYIGGVKLTWNFGNYYTNKNNKRQIQTNINTIETQRVTFLFNTNLDIIQKNHTISNYRDQLKYDDEIIALRGSVKKSSDVKMANGTLSGTDLMRDINAEQRAIQDKILHETELLLAIYNLKFVTNN